MIIRTEVAPTINCPLEHTAGREYIRRLNTLADTDDQYWAHNDEMDAANSCNTDITDTEEWNKWILPYSDRRQNRPQINLQAVLLRSETAPTGAFFNLILSH